MKITEKEKYHIFIILSSAIIILCNSCMDELLYLEMFWGISVDVVLNIRTFILTLFNFIFMISSITFIISSMKNYVNTFRK